ncbi:MAG: hypothetical protein KDC35_01495, partial [Acidobacteria bacterium]|nr:hypothetical protein [Acidobacteriota bacterium]
LCGSKGAARSNVRVSAANDLIALLAVIFIVTSSYLHHQMFLIEVECNLDRSMYSYIQGMTKRHDCHLVAELVFSLRRNIFGRTDHLYYLH